MVDAAQEQAFAEFVRSRAAALLRYGYLLVGHRQAAEDLLQTALVKTFVAWPRIADPAALERYVRRTMATTAVSWWRGRPYRERPAETLPEPPGLDDLDGRVEREALWQELAALPARQRAVLVLRYYEGLDEAEIAEVLNVSRGTVKSHAARALARLRRRLAVGQPDSGAVRS